MTMYRSGKRDAAARINVCSYGRIGGRYWRGRLIYQDGRTVMTTRAWVEVFVDGDGIFGACEPEEVLIPAGSGSGESGNSDSYAELRIMWEGK